MSHRMGRYKFNGASLQLVDIPSGREQSVKREDNLSVGL